MSKRNPYDNDGNSDRLLTRAAQLLTRDSLLEALQTMGTKAAQIGSALRAALVAGTMLASTQGYAGPLVVGPDFTTIQQAHHMGELNVQDYHLEADGTDWGPALRRVMLDAYTKGCSVWIPRRPTPYLITDPGVWAGPEVELEHDGWPRYIARLYDGVHIRSNGATLKLSGGRNRPCGIFAQDFYIDANINNVKIEGLIFDQSGHLQTNVGLYSQFGHTLAIYSGKNIEVTNCRFFDVYGDAILTGNTGNPTLNQFHLTNFSIHHCEFEDIYREAIMCCSNSHAFIHHNHFHGNWYLVSAVDIERHALNDHIENIIVTNNVFDFRDGFGVVENNGLTKRTRRAVTATYYYDRETATDTGLAHILIANNIIHQGTIGTMMTDNLSIVGNKIINLIAENMDGVDLTTFGCAIYLDSEGSVSESNKPRRTIIADNEIYSATYRTPTFATDGGGAAIWSLVQRDIHINNNRIYRSYRQAIFAVASSGQIKGNYIKDAGSVGLISSGIISYHSYFPLIIDDNTIIETRSGGSRYTSYGVELAGYATDIVTVSNNKARNVITGVTKDSADQPDYAQFDKNYLLGSNSPINSDRDHSFGSNTKAGIGLILNKAAGAIGAIYFRVAGINRISISSTDGGFNVNTFDATGAYQRSPIQITASGIINCNNAGGFTLPGFFDEPTNLEDIRLWRNAAGQIVSKPFSDPADINDGWVFARRRPVPTTALQINSGSPGDYAVSASYLYICTTTDNWKRVSIDTW